MTNNTKTIIGVGAGVLLLLYLRKRKNSDVNTLRGVSADEGDDGTGGTDVASGGGGLGGAIGGIFGGGGGVAPSPIVINNPTTNTLRPMPIAQLPVSSRPQVSLRPQVSSRPQTSPNTTQAVSQAPMRSNFLMFDGTFYGGSDLDFDGNIID